MTYQSRKIDPDQFFEANRDYIDRLEREGLFLVYDSALDTLFIEFGGPKAACGFTLPKMSQTTSRRDIPRWLHSWSMYVMLWRCPTWFTDVRE